MKQIFTKMPTQRDLFEVSGPTYLTSVNWSCPQDQRVVAASLVQATYILEEDRVNKRAGPKALAPAWWQPFHFDCIETLEDNDSTVFGCIYEFKPPFSPHPSAPRFIITFRGTMLDVEHVFEDLFLDVHVIIGGINRRTRFKTAVGVVQKLIRNYKPEDIWLTGHSLGASIATLTGKYIAMNDTTHLKTFLFNPPFPSISLDSFPSLDDNLKERMRFCKTIVKGGVSLVMQKQHKKSREEFLKLAPWTPYLFVHQEDPISTSYIRYFEGLNKAKGTILECIEQVAARTSLREICSNVLGRESEMSHLLPSARLAENLKKFNDCRESHRLHQWWQQDISLKFVDYHYQQKKC